MRVYDMTKASLVSIRDATGVPIEMIYPGRDGVARVRRLAEGETLVLVGEPGASVRIADRNRQEEVDDGQQATTN